MILSKNQIICFGLIFHVLAAIFSIGHHQSDELFQIFEFAGYKLGINNLQDLPWEFVEKMRSGIQPLIVYCITKLCYAVNIYNPFNIALFVRLLQSLFSFFVTIKFLEIFEREIKSELIKRALWVLTLLLWCIPYFHTRFSSENFSSTLFIYGFLLVYQQNEQNKNLTKSLFGGFLLGLSFIARFQIIFFILGLCTWLLFVSKINVRNFVLILSGFILALILGTAIDYWLYDNFVLSWWNYIDQNIFHSKANYFGTSPFYFYLFEAILKLIPPFSLLLIYGLFFFWIKNAKNVVTWITLPFVALHVIVPHKELRFLFPMLNFLPLIFCFFLQTIQFETNTLKRILFSNAFIKFAVIVNCILLLFFNLKPADENSLIYKKIFETVQGQRPVLYYNKTNPYNKQAGLNFFRNNKIVTKPALNIINEKNSEAYLYFDGFSNDNTLVKNNCVFTRVYSSYPDWIIYFNFNHWLERANTFSIYKMRQ